MFTDSHCHLASHKFPREEVADLVSRARDAGIHRLITLATCPEDIPSNLALAEEFPEVHACLGIHPCDVHETPDDFEGSLHPLLSHEKVAAVGETGLDYYHPAPEGWTNEDYHARQRDFLRRHFLLARESGLNVVIHTRDRSGTASFDDALAIAGDFTDSVRAVFHCFPGPPELAERVFAIGGLISFTGIVTFKNAREVAATAVTAPEGRFMLETDSPYLAPVPHRGQRNEPAYTREIAEHIANERGITPATLSQVTEATVKGFFRLQP